LNQSAFIARFVSRTLGIPLRVTLLKKVRDTDQQSTLSARERHKNLIKAFHCKHCLDGQHIALIDDILTTGSTANEISKILKAAGAARVDIWVCARTS
jgi:predicted amidophosphoribosyltransferase